MSFAAVFQVPMAHPCSMKSSGSESDFGSQAHTDSDPDPGDLDCTFYFRSRIKLKLVRARGEYHDSAGRYGQRGEGTRGHAVQGNRHGRPVLVEQIRADH